jgi:hypothetical protein
MNAVCLTSIASSSLPIFSLSLAIKHKMSPTISWSGPYDRLYVLMHFVNIFSASSYLPSLRARTTSYWASTKGHARVIFGGCARALAREASSGCPGIHMQVCELASRESGRGPCFSRGRLRFRNTPARPLDPSLCLALGSHHLAKMFAMFLRASATMTCLSP